MRKSTAVVCVFDLKFVQNEIRKTKSKEGQGKQVPERNRSLVKKVCRVRLKNLIKSIKIPLQRHFEIIFTRVYLKNKNVYSLTSKSFQILMGFQILMIFKKTFRYLKLAQIHLKQHIFLPKYIPVESMRYLSDY